MPRELVIGAPVLDLSDDGTYVEQIVSCQPAPHWVYGTWYADESHVVLKPSPVEGTETEEVQRYVAFPDGDGRTNLADAYMVETLGFQGLIGSTWLRRCDAGDYWSAILNDIRRQ
jgi:hypothetical protein